MPPTQPWQPVLNSARAHEHYDAATREAMRLLYIGLAADHAVKAGRYTKGSTFWQFHEREYARAQQIVSDCEKPKGEPCYAIAAAQAGGVVFEALCDDYGRDAARAILDTSDAEALLWEAQDVLADNALNADHD